VLLILNYMTQRDTPTNQTTFVNFIIIGGIIKALINDILIR